MTEWSKNKEKWTISHDKVVATFNPNYVWQVVETVETIKLQEPVIKETPLTIIEEGKEKTIFVKKETTEIDQVVKIEKKGLVTVKIGKKTLKLGGDFTVEIQNIINNESEPDKAILQFYQECKDYQIK